MDKCLVEQEDKFFYIDAPCIEDLFLNLIFLYPFLHLFIFVVFAFLIPLIYGVGLDHDPGFNKHVIALTPLVV